MEKIKFALIGCGAISRKHVIALQRIPDAEIVAAYDIDRDSLKQFHENYAIPVYDDIDLLVQETNPDIFDILTPSGIHGQSIKQLLKYNKNFVVEKPIALNLEEVDEIIESCDKRGIKIFVVQQNRFNPPIQILKRALELGRFGKLTLGTVRIRWCRRQTYYDEKPWRGTWALDGGVLSNQASHHIDMLLWMMGEVETVYAKTATMLAKIETEDTGVGILKFKNGALGIVEATTATRPKDLEGSISILGEKGAVEIGGFFMNEIITWSFCEEHEMDKEIEMNTHVPKEDAWNHTQFFLNVITSLKNNSQGLIDGLQGRRSIELITALYESSETGKEIQLRFAPRKSRLGIPIGKVASIPKDSRLSFNIN